MAEEQIYPGVYFTKGNPQPTRSVIGGGEANESNIVASQQIPLGFEGNAEMLQVWFFDVVSW